MTTPPRGTEDGAETTTRLPRVSDRRPAGSPGGRPAARRPLLVGAAVAGLLAILYVGDLLFSTTDVPRGVEIAGVEIGGRSRPEAQALLRAQLASRSVQPVTVRAGDATATLDPVAAGLVLDVDASVARAGEQPRNPWTRLRSLFTTRAVAPATSTAPAVVAAAVDGLRPQLERAPVEGTVVFRGAEPIGVPARPGQLLGSGAADRGTVEAAETLTAHWLDPAPVVLPTRAVDVTVTGEGIETALRDVARPATAGPVTVAGDGATATLSPEEIGTVLRFVPDGSGGLVPRVDTDAAARLLRPRLAGTERAAKDATYAFGAGEAPEVVPAVEGRAVVWDRTLAGLLPVLARPAGADRALTATYATTPPRVTTAALEALGAPTVIGEFRTGGFAPDSGQNIKRVAEQVNGATVAAGATFSLNGHTGTRDASRGYVEAGIIDDGVPGRGVGGGISQFATTLYNASYFAGLVDVEHQEHSYWISRYPAGREATVFEGAIDLRFRNDGPSPVLIRTRWTASSITVQIYGQKRYEVTSSPGPRTNPVPAGTRDLSARPACKPSAGVAGFTITDTRTLRDVATGAVRTQPRTVRYEPEPQVTCGG